MEFGQRHLLVIQKLEASIAKLRVSNFMCNKILMAVCLFSLISCERAPDGMDREFDRNKITGCYLSPDLPETNMRITAEAIEFDGKTIYDRYEYGLDGRTREPIIYVWPRLIPVEISGRLEFRPYRGGDGGLTLITERAEGEMLISLATFEEDSFPDGHIRWFTKARC